MLALRNACRLSLAFRRRVIPRPPALKRCFVRREKAVCVQERRRFTSLSSRHSSAAASRLECSSDGKKCQVLWSDGEQSTYHAVWLRHNCQCPECWDDTANQKLLVDINELRSDLRIHSVTGSSHKMDICWSYGQGEKEHHGYVNLEWLKKNSYSADALHKLRAQSQPTIATSLPRISYSEVSKGEEGVWKWLKNLNVYGVCLVTDMPTNAEEVRKLAKVAGGIQETCDGEVFHLVAVENAINVAYTTRPLDFHMDMTYFESPPGLQILHCIRNDDCVEGGESVLLDLLPVVEDMRRKFPQHFTTLTRVPATFERINPKKEIDIPVALKYRKPHITLDTSGEISAVDWNPVSIGALQVPEEDVEQYYEAYFCLGRMIADSKLKLCHRLKPGEAVTLNNRRFVHSRTGFKLNGGSRHLEGAFVNTDTFKSKVRLLASRFEPEFAVKSVLNQDHGGY